MIKLMGDTIINCLTSLTNQKQWLIYELDQLTGTFLREILLVNNPSINYADLVLQPQTLSYGLYMILFTVTMENVSFTSFAETFIRITPSGLVLSSQKLRQSMYGGTIEITRGQNQSIQFDPFIFTYDIDNEAAISSLKFKYACQIIDLNVTRGYPQIPGENQTIYLNDFKINYSLTQYMQCFNSICNIFVKCNALIN